jgi:NADPH:quinone reductase-like Zn-dependent oxidoreductase
VHAESGGAGVDVILDNIGGAYLQRNMKSLAVGGRLIVLGLQGGRKGELDLGALLAKRATVHAAGLRARPLAQKAAIVAETQHAVWPLIESGEVRPIIDRTFDLADAADAHRLVESSEHIGKVLLKV